MTKTLTQILFEKWSGVEYQPEAVQNYVPQYADHYRNTLQHGIHVVEFRKVNGEITTMEVTLDPRFLPPNPSTSAAQPSNQLRVWSTDRQGWRSFRVDSVLKFYPKLEAL